MSVLTLKGKPIDWANPPSATTLVMWSKRTTGGKIVKGSLRSIAHLDHLDTLALKKFGAGVSVMQSAYNKGYALSKGTHDYDAVFDGWIYGVEGPIQQAFFRANGAGAFYRTPAQGFTPHLHWFCLPPSTHAGASEVSQRYKRGGFKVGYLVDGGWSLYGKVVGSSQIGDYYANPPRDALAGHAADNTWHPDDIDATIFDLAAYIKRQRAKIRVTRSVFQAGRFTATPAQWRAMLNSHSKIADVILLSETSRVHDVLKGWAEGHKWHLWHPTKAGASECAILSRAPLTARKARRLSALTLKTGRTAPIYEVSARVYRARWYAWHSPAHNGGLSTKGVYAWPTKVYQSCMTGLRKIVRKDKAKNRAVGSDWNVATERPDMQEELRIDGMVWAVGPNQKPTNLGRVTDAFQTDTEIMEMGRTLPACDGFDHNGVWFASRFPDAA